MKVRMASLALFFLLACTSRTSETPVEAKEAPEVLDFQRAISIEPRLAEDAVVVSIRLEPGFHTYTTGETVGRPLKLTLAEDGVWQATGAPSYPEGKKKETALGTSVVVENNAEVRLPVEPTVPSPGALRGKLRYQVCTETACDRPREAIFELTQEG